MAWTLLAAGFCFYLPNHSAAKVPLVAFFVFMFAGTLPILHKYPQRNLIIPQLSTRREKALCRSRTQLKYSL
jgi:hypothetical protein